MADTDDQVGFCRSEFWDLSVTWQTENPDFTDCFHETVLLYVPLAMLLVLTPLQLYWNRHSPSKGVPWSAIGITRTFLTALLILLAFVDLIWAWAALDTGAAVYIVAAVVKMISYSLAVWLHVSCMKDGQVSSAILFIFWSLSAALGALTFRSMIIRPQDINQDTTYLFQYPVLVAIFFLNFWADPPPIYKGLDEDETEIIPETYASFPSRCVFAWFDSLAFAGWRSTLRESDLWLLSQDNRCCEIVPKWESRWDKEVSEASKAGNEVSIVKTLIRLFGPSYMWTSLLNLVYSVLQFANPLIVGLLIDFVQSNEPQWKGYLYLGLICLVTFTNSVINANTFYRQYMVGLRVKTALITAIYKKSTRLSNVGRKEMTVGETTNLMSIDTQRFMDIMLYLNMMWSAPLQVALAIYFLWQLIGPSALAGLAVMVLLIPLNSVVAQRMKMYQISQMHNKDQRSKLMDEILNGIKVLKLYSWEQSFAQMVLDIRKKEMGALIKAAYLTSFTTFVWTSAPFLVALASFATYVLSDPSHVLDANKAFVSLTLFNLLRIPLNILPMMIVMIVQCQVSIVRFNKFMNAGELSPDNVSHSDEHSDAVVVENGSFTWDDDINSQPVLKDINLAVAPGSLVAIVGQVGAGKSSLLSAMLGEMKKISGRVNMAGKLAYVPQQAWIQNASLRDNILFGNMFNQKLYDCTLEACALLPDLEMLPGRDLIEIGEKGINLSGGQKQRISLARSVYSKGSLYLLDDPMSAVDAHVGKHIFERVIGPNGLLRNKTRILVTNAISYLPQMDKIYVIKDGCISEEGTYSELMVQGGEFAEFLVEYLAKMEEEGATDPQTESELEGLKHELESIMGKETLQRQLSGSYSIKTPISCYGSSKGSFPGMLHRRNHSTAARPSEDEMKALLLKGVGQNLIEDEKIEVGRVKWSVYKYYIQSIGAMWTFLCLFFYLGYQSFQLGGNAWLSTWSTDLEASTDESVRNKYLSIFGLLGFLQALSVMVASGIGMVATLNASTKLHHRMLHRILHSPMSFFDTTPLGRILNRFSKDIDIMDITMPMNLRLLLVQMFNVVGTVVIVCITNAMFIIVAIPVAVMFYFLQNFYVTTARQVKRLEAVTRSPIYSHFGETLSGASTIRAYNAVDRFILENERKLDVNQKCYQPTFTSNCWLAVRLESIGNLIILFSSLFAVIYRDSMDPGNVGLALSYALNVTGSMTMLVRMISEVETNMICVERIQEYQGIVQEAPDDIPESDPPDDWPQFGVVKFDNYSTRYREGLDLVLQGVSIDIQSGEKIGICGRTGAGKSSLTLALFRIIEADQGDIYIDGVNIKHLGLRKLRSRLTIIPQDPVLFSGSIRMNLDPFEQHSDRNIWNALEMTHLRSFVSNLPGGLHFAIKEGGDNLSVGQRQLVCLARALLRKTKVLILDEATAAIDLETDDLIQQTIRTGFSDCTVLTIAHRLNTIMDSSRVVVLEAGSVKELDTPENLLRNKDSIFYSMAKNAGLTNGSDEC